MCLCLIVFLTHHSDLYAGLPLKRGQHSDVHVGVTLTPSVDQLENFHCVR